MNKVSITKANISRLQKNMMGNIPNGMIQKNILKSKGIRIDTYSELVKEIAELSFRNKKELLFFRGQNKDYRNKANSTTMYPKIFRNDPLTESEFNFRMKVLEKASKLLIEKVTKSSKRNSSIALSLSDIKKKKYVQWSLLQHYEICQTPLIDLTHSLKVACSFSQLDNKDNVAYVYVISMPYITNRISVNSEEDIVNIRLLSISPPFALRPYYQEGYLAGTEFVTDEYDNKTEFDLNRRIVAKYIITNDESFWDGTHQPIDKSLLYPKNDEMEQIAKNVRDEMYIEATNETVGQFLKSWNKLQDKYSREFRLFSEAIKYMYNTEQISPEDYKTLKEIRFFRNRLVHTINEQYPSELEVRKYIDLLNKFIT